MSGSAVGRVSSSLVIHAANSSHSGLYECEAANSLGSARAQAAVTVYGKSFMLRLLAHCMKWPLLVVWCSRPSTD